MIVQAIPVIPKHRNEPHRECLYAWYPEVVNDTTTTISKEPRDIYIHNGLDKDLLEIKPSTNGSANTCNNNNTSAELLQRYKPSIAPSDRPYHSTETIDEALNPPWALHYQIKRGPATPNLSTNSTDMSIYETPPPRRLKSAPVVRSLPSTSILNIPEPRFIIPVIPVTTTNRTPTPARIKTRASSAKARLNTTVPNENQPPCREIRSAQVSRSKGNKKLTNEEVEQIFEQVYGNHVEQLPIQQEQPIQIIYTQPPPSSVSPLPVYIYQKSASWCPDEVSPSTPVRKSVEINDVSLNPHHIYRPGHIAVQNNEKQPVLRENLTLKNTTKHRRRYNHSHGRRNEPLLALTPMPHKPKLSLEIGGIKLKYDPKISFEDRSPNLTKYFIDGRLYLIKDQRYNVIDNIDPSILEKYNQSLARSSRSKYYQTIPIEKFQIPQTSTELQYNVSDTYSYNSSPKHLQRYVIDPNVISENLSVNKMSLSKRPPTATVYA